MAAYVFFIQLTTYLSMLCMHSHTWSTTPYQKPLVHSLSDITCPPLIKNRVLQFWTHQAFVWCVSVLNGSICFFHSTNHIFKYVMLRPSIMYINILDGSFLSFHSILFIYFHHWLQHYFLYDIYLYIDNV
jgi:hypothetical protein